MIHPRWRRVTRTEAVTGIYGRNGRNTSLGIAVEGVAGQGGNDFENAPTAAEKDSPEPVGSGGKQERRALSPVRHPSLYQSGQ